MTPRAWLQRAIGQMRELSKMPVGRLAAQSGVAYSRVIQIEANLGAPATDEEIGDLLRVLLG